MQRLYSVGGAVAITSALLLGQCNPSPPKPPPPAQSAEYNAHTASKAIEVANSFRARHGLPKLKSSTATRLSALEHSIDQARRDRMSHTGSDGSNAGDRLRSNGGSFRRWSENVAAGYRGATAVVKAWMNSPGHRRNILDPNMTRMSIARADAKDGTRYWTMVMVG